MTIRAHEQCTILPLTTLSSQQATIAKNSKTTFSYYTTNETQSMDHHLGYEAELVPSTCPEHTTACTAGQHMHQCRLQTASAVAVTTTCINTPGIQETAGDNA